MKYLSVCSGIEAATVAWHPMGWEAVGYSEIEKFPSSVLEHHYPNVPNFGDMTKFKEWNLDTVNLLVGGTPCQSFSVAGLRKGLEDPRGNLALTYCGILDHFRPQWFIWENVPGVLSSGGGRDFGSFLGAVAELGYGFAYRVLDAQYFGVAQRRRRVFVVGYFGDWRPASEVLFEPESLCRDNPPSRKTRQDATVFTPSSIGGYRQGAGTLRASGGDLGGGSEHLVAQPYEIGNTLTARMHKGMNSDCNEGQTPVLQPIATQDVAGTMLSRNTSGGFSNSIDHAAAGYMALQPIALAENTIGRLPHNGGNGDGFTEGGPMYTLNASGVHGIAQPIPFKETADCLTSAYGTKWNGNASATNGSLFVAQPVVVHGTQDPCVSDIAFAQGRNNGGENVVAVPMEVPEVMATLLSSTAGISRPGNAVTEHLTYIPMSNMAVRRLTPVECERLQGFPDNYTDIKPKGKDTPDGPRYKALGNSMAVPVMAWIGRRIQAYEDKK